MKSKVKQIELPPVAKRQDDKPPAAQPDLGGALGAIVANIYERFPAPHVRRRLYKIILSALVDNGVGLPDVETGDLVYQEVRREMV